MTTTTVRPGAMQAGRYGLLHDTLTDLPNRRYLLLRLERALSRIDPPREPVAVLQVDLDGIQAIADLHGRETAGQAVQAVAARLKHSMRAEDMVCRLGDGGFGCLLIGQGDRRQLSRVAAKIGTLLVARMQIAALQVAVHASIGIVLSVAGQIGGEELLRRAGAAAGHARHYRTLYAFYRDPVPSGVA